MIRCLSQEFPANELWSRSLLPLISKSLFWRRKKRPLRPAMFAISFSVTWRRRIFPFILSGVSLITEGDHKLCGGIQRGACAPLCVVAGVGFIREGPHRKGPSLVRLFGHFLSAQKVTRGVGPGRPHEKGPGGGAPESHRIEWQLFGKRDVSPPPARRHANLSPSVPCAGTDPSKKIEARRQAGLQDHHAMSFSISSSRVPNRSRASWTGLGEDMSTPAPFSRSTGSLEQPPERN